MGEETRDAPSLDAGLDAPVPIEELERRVDELTVRGAPGEEADRPMTGGPDAGAELVLAGLDAGLSHEEKKSSSPLVASLPGVSATPSTKILVGNLQLSKKEQTSCEAMLRRTWQHPLSPVSPVPLCTAPLHDSSTSFSCPNRSTERIRRAC